MPSDWTPVALVAVGTISSSLPPKTERAVSAYEAR